MSESGQKQTHCFAPVCLLPPGADIVPPGAHLAIVLTIHAAASSISRAGSEAWCNNSCVTSRERRCAARKLAEPVADWLRDAFLRAVYARAGRISPAPPGAAALPAASCDPEAQSYPSRPITMIVPFPAGGAVDSFLADRPHAPLS
jgi:hypothetical protein